MKKLFIILLMASVYAACSASPHHGAGVTLYQMQNDSIPDINQLIGKHQYGIAVELLESKLADTVSTELLNQAGYCYSKLGRYSEAVSAYERSISLDSANTITLSRLAGIYKNEDKFLEAGNLYNKLTRSDSLNSYFFKQHAYCLYKAGLLPFSVALYEQANRLNPADQEVILNLAGIYIKQEKFVFCDSLLNRSLASDPANIRFLLLKARSKYSQKEYDSTLVALETVFALGDTGLTAIRLAGNAHYALDNYEKSISWFEKIPPNLSKEDEYVNYMMGVSYKHLGQPRKSILHLEKAIELGISGNISFYYRQLGHSYENNGEINQALVAFETARQYKKEGILDYQIARIHDYYKNDPEAALEYYKRYLASGDSAAREAWEFSRDRIKQLE